MKIYISSCNLVKSGIKDGRKWSLYHITDPQGKRYSTFEAKYSGLVGQEVDVFVKEEQVEKNGKTYTNRTIIEPRRTPDTSAVMKELAEIKIYVMRTYAKVSELTTDEPSSGGIKTSEDGPDEQDVEPDDLPPLPF